MANQRESLPTNGANGLKRHLTLAVFIAIVISGILAVSALADAPDEGVVVEGFSVPGVELGFTRAQVESAWGAPAYCQNVSGYDQGSCKFYAEGGGSIFVRYRGADGGPAQNSPDDVAYIIRWHQQVSEWVTTAGVNTTLAYNSQEAVLEAYPDATIHYQSLFDWSIDDPAQGIHVYYHTSYLTGALSVSMGITFPTTPPPPPEEFFVLVRSIDFYSTQRNQVGARVQVQEYQAGYVEGAVVSATWTTPDGSQTALSATTDSFGKAYFDLGKLKRKGTYTLTIDDVAVTGFTFDPEISVLSASLTK
ncbi:MAG: hypothetical protein PVI99_09325 [Anaerolineales bacterium]|jgi:hypothetical protein